MNFRFLEYKCLKSTNSTAKEFAKAGEGEGLVVVSREQTGGRGRLGRAFSSPPGGLYMSILLRPTFPREEAPLLTALCGVCARRGIAAVTGERPLIKWPNDIFLGKKKVCGILCEGLETAKGFAVIAGIGVNVSGDEAFLPPGAGVLSKKKLDTKPLKGIILSDVGALYEKWDKAAIMGELYSFLYAPSAEAGEWAARYIP